MYRNDFMIIKFFIKKKNIIKVETQLNLDVGMTNYTDIYRFIFQEPCKKLILFATHLCVSDSNFNLSAFFSG